MTTFANQAVPSPRQERELIPADSPIAGFISVNPGIMHGEPCFKGTRVPIQILFDYVSGGDSLEEFLTGFPNVSRNAAIAVIELATRGLIGGLRNL